jgi:hypothetical protein
MALSDSEGKKKEEKILLEEVDRDRLLNVEETVH